MEQREEGALRVGRRFQKGVAEQRLVESHFVEYLPQRLAAAVGPLDESDQSRISRSQTNPLPEM